MRISHGASIIELICSNVSKRLGLLSRIRSYFTLKAVKCVYICLVQPISDHIDTVWSAALSIGYSNSLQRLQKRAANVKKRGGQPVDPLNSNFSAYFFILFF